jgi:thioredoxin 1
MWCGPCQRQAPILESFASSNSDRVKVCQIDIDESPDIAAKYNVRSIPTLMFFKGGKSVQTKVGMHSVVMLETLLQSVIKD